VASSDEADDVLVPYLKASEELRTALDVDRAVYWGEFIDLVDSALKENVEKARLRVETALAIARQEFEKRFGELDSATREAMLRVIEGGYAPEKYDEQLLDCPACGTERRQVVHAPRSQRHDAVRQLLEQLDRLCSQISLRSAAQRVSSCRDESWSFRRTLDTWASTVFADRWSRAAISL
jgi:hypothetical protein